MENNKPNNPNAFPSDVFNEAEGERFEHEGMSLRDYFAAKAMQGILSNADTMREINKENTKMKGDLTSFMAAISAISYSYSDAMLKQREL